MPWCLLELAKGSVKIFHRETDYSFLRRIPIKVYAKNKPHPVKMKNLVLAESS